VYRIDIPPLASTVDVKFVDDVGPVDGVAARLEREGKRAEKKSMTNRRVSCIEKDV
jgi:hypothetical protein